MFKKAICLAMSLSFLVTSTAGATGIAYMQLGQELDLDGVQMAQVPPPPTPASIVEAGTYAQGVQDGITYAEGYSTGGKMFGGVILGSLTGLVGTAIGWGLTGPASLDANAMQALKGKSADYARGFDVGWKNKTKSRKRGAVLGGGLIGTAIFVGIYILATSD